MPRSRKAPWWPPPPLPALIHTCDVYHAGSSAPAPPDVAGVACFLLGSFGQALEAGESDTANYRPQKILIVPVAADIRDSYQYGNFAFATASDLVYIPDQGGTAYKVIFVERRCRGTPADHKRVYLTRNAVPTWPTDEV